MSIETRPPWGSPDESAGAPEFTEDLLRVTTTKVGDQVNVALTNGGPLEVRSTYPIELRPGTHSYNVSVIVPDGYNAAGEVKEFSLQATASALERPDNPEQPVPPNELDEVWDLPDTTTETAPEKETGEDEDWPDPIPSPDPEDPWPPVPKALEVFTLAKAGVRIPNGKEGESVVAVAELGQVTVEPTTYQKGRHVYQVRVEVPPGFSNSGEVLHGSKSAYAKRKSWWPWGGEQEPDELVVNGIDGETYTLDVSNDTLYVFLYGKRATGKTMMIASLIHFLAKDRKIKLKLDSENVEVKQRFYSYINSVKDGVLQPSTATIKTGDKVQEIQLVVDPNDQSFPPLNLSLIDLAGEDLEELLVTKDNTRGDLDPRIRAYLEHVPASNFLFVVLLPADDPHPHDEVVHQFMNYLEFRDLEEADVLLTGTKWDLVPSGIEDVRQLVEENELIFIPQLLSGRNGRLSFLEFSVGEPIEGEVDRFQHNDNHSLRLANAIYRLGHGLDVSPWAMSGKVPGKPKKAWFRFLKKKK